MRQDPGAGNCLKFLTEMDRVTFDLTISMKYVNLSGFTCQRPRPGRSTAGEELLHALNFPNTLLLLLPPPPPLPR